MDPAMADVPDAGYATDLSFLIFKIMNPNKNFCQPSSRWIQKISKGE